MSNPLGRFEFRIWGNHLSQFRDRLAAIAVPSEPVESAETYILSRATDAANVKVRAGLIDVKLLIEQLGRLERWRPALKAEFPLDSRTIVEQVFPNLRVAAPHIVQPSYTHGEFVRGVVGPERDLAPVDVVKVRRRFKTAEYTGEFVEVRIAGGATSESVAIESEDPAVVLRAIAKLGLTPHPNISYVRHLKLMTGMTPRTVSAN
jgi:exopolyphosphatase/guanosine-5'-triphosphate,3'-diphosphate pyrophosphatase